MTPARRRRRTPSFYERALAASDRDLLADAREVEGLDEEVAVLRLHVRRLLEDCPEDPAALQAGMRLLVQALTARHRLSGREADTLTQAANNLMEYLIAVFVPAEGGAS